MKTFLILIINLVLLTTSSQAFAVNTASSLASFHNKQSTQTVSPVLYNDKFVGARSDNIANVASAVCLGLGANRVVSYKKSKLQSPTLCYAPQAENGATVYDLTSYQCEYIITEVVCAH